jgi:hypothetical protein
LALASSVSFKVRLTPAKQPISRFLGNLHIFARTVDSRKVGSGQRLHKGDDKEHEMVYFKEHHGMGWWARPGICVAIGVHLYVYGCRSLIEAEKIHQPLVAGAQLGEDAAAKCSTRAPPSPTATA